MDRLWIDRLWIDRRWGWKQWSTGGLALTFALAGIGGALLYGSPEVPIVDLQLAGTANDAREVLEAEASAAEASELFKEAIERDWLFMLGYLIAGAGLCYLGARIFVKRAARNLAQAAFMSTIAAFLLDAIENFVLLGGLASIEDGSGSDGLFRAAAASAAIKFALLAFAAPVALTALVVVAKRVLSRSKPGAGTRRMHERIIVPRPVVDSTGDRRPLDASAAAPVVEADPAHAHHRYSAVVPPGREPGLVGFCVSGGGIRSACVALGAFQKLREFLLRARYLVSVSGGGYLAGAMQLALYPDPPPAIPGGSPDDLPQSIATPRDVYESGSVEEDHTRRHGSYIADGAAQWLSALWTVLRGILASMSITNAAIISLGLALAYFYSVVEFVRPDRFLSYLDQTATSSPAFPSPLGFAGWTVLWVAVAATILWLVSIALIDRKHFAGKFRHRVQSTSNALLKIAGLLALLVFVIPGVLWVTAKVAWIAGDQGATSEAVGGVTGTVFLTYFGALAAILWRRRERLATEKTKLFGLFGKQEGGAVRAVPTSFVQYVIVWVVLGVIVLVGFLVLGITIITGPEWSGWVQLGIPLGLLVVYLVVDQTWMGLHTFYRRRLATAFSVRRVALAKGDIAARPYDFDREGTPLSRYGARREPFPQVIFACAAHLSGADRTPPRRRAVSYSMSYDYIGGPEVGYLPTGDTQDVISGPLRADLTVQAAMAVSGAAFASSMGRQARAFQTLLALSNARLGTWLPNPAYVRELSAPDAPWWIPGLPRIRRLTYLMREIFGQFPHDDRLLMVTDGGHYENLGLVELLRHRCRTIFCIDASGDAPPFPQTLTEAITLAKEELGIEITLEKHAATALVPGTGAPIAAGEALRSLNERLSSMAAVVGKITYPTKFKAPGEARASAGGTLIFAKAVLTPDAPTEILAYAATNKIFPRDGTGDQWFSHDQFDAYEGLGRYIGAQAAEAAHRAGV